MPSYMLLLHDPSTFGEGLSPEDIQAIIQKYRAWSDRMRESGVLLRGVKLQDGTGRVMRGSMITDGPFAESKEIIGGFFQIKADNYDAAVEIARTCPHMEYGTIEVRQVEIE